MPKLAEEFGWKILRRRGELSLSQEEVAERMGINRDTYRKFEKTGTVPEKRRDALARALETTWEELAGGLQYTGMARESEASCMPNRPGGPNFEP